VEKALVEDSKLVRNGKKSIQIKGKINIQTFSRQILLEKRRKRVRIPINDFFQRIQQGKAFISKNLEKEVIKQCLISSYRSSERSVGKKLSKDSIRRAVLEKKEKAERLEKTTIREEQNTEGKLKDAENAKSSYKQSKGGIMRSIFGKIFNRNVLYLMADGVGVEQQDKTQKGIKLGKRECKVGVFLKQTGDQIKQIATFCTWKRIDQFKSTLEWVLLGIFSFKCKVIIISDGAKWIRNLRKKIPALKNAEWILDWFHLKDRILKVLRKLELDEDSETTQTILSLCWFGKIDLALEIIQKLPLSQDEEEAAQQRQAIEGYQTYIHNQCEGIINYQAYKMKGYLVGSGCVEKINDQLVKDRMVRQGRMRWGTEGGEAMMLLLTAMWNGRLAEVFA
jgi:hypothetical protein